MSSSSDRYSNACGAGKSVAPVYTLARSLILKWRDAVDDPRDLDLQPEMSRRAQDRHGSALYGADDPRKVSPDMKRKRDLALSAEFQ